jgi:hypothetical protein
MPNPFSRKPHTSFGPADFFWRLLAALALVLASYNPAGFSYFHWVSGAISRQDFGPAHVFVGVALLIGWTVFGVATRNSLGTLGTLLSAALIGTGIWLLTRIGVVHADSASAITWLALVALATLLAIGLSWSHIWRRLSGQLEVDDNSH